MSPTLVNSRIPPHSTVAYVEPSCRSFRPTCLPLLPSSLPVAMSYRGAVCALVVALACSAHAFYLPGLAPTDFCTAKYKEANSNNRCKVGRFWRAATPALIPPLPSPPDEGERARQQTRLGRIDRPVRVHQASLLSFPPPPPPWGRRVGRH